MEGFFEDLIRDIIAFHEANATLVGDLPSTLRVTQMWRAVEDHAQSLDDAKKLGALQTLKAHKLADDDERCGVGVFDSDVYIRGFAVPGSREVKKLFGTMGVPEIWDQLEAVDPDTKLLKNSLDALVSRRHPIAHGDAAAKATPDDVRAYVDDMLKLSEHFDSLVYSVVSVFCAHDDPWRSITSSAAS